MILAVITIACRGEEITAPEGLARQASALAVIGGAPSVDGDLSLGAAATGAPTASYTFYDCVGPSGTPGSFTAVKTAVPPQTGAPVSAAAAFRLTDGSAVFVVLAFGSAFSPPGIAVSGNATTTCSVSLGGSVWAFSGFLAPTS
jgi:hypothetical protein